MSMAAILVMWPWPFEEIFFCPPTHGGAIWNLAKLALLHQRRCLKILTMTIWRKFVFPNPWKSIWNLALIGPEEVFENVDNDGQWMTEACLYYKLTNKPSAQVN